LIAAAVIAGAIGMASGAMAFPVFTVDENAPNVVANTSPAGICGVPTLCTTHQADQLGLNYTSAIQLTAGAIAGSGSFSETGSLAVSSFLLNGNQVSGTNVGSRYSLLANFQGDGTFTNNGGGQLTGSFAHFTVQLFLAPVNQTKDPLTQQFTFGNSDVLVATGIQNGPGVSHLFPTNTAKGDSHVFDTFMVLDPTYFTDPSNPFYIAFDASGNVNANSCTPITPNCADFLSGNTTEGEQIVIGSAGGGQAQFDVPEPGMLAIFGAGLFGLAAFRRKQRVS
jgi:hypothetical protein